MLSATKSFMKADGKLAPLLNIASLLATVEANNKAI